MDDDWRSIKLKPFKEVLRDIPPIPGEPYPMKVHEIDGPKNCGDPWKGAYSEHGYWYKFHEGNEEDYSKIVELANEQNGYFLVNPESEFHEGKQLIVVKSLKNEILGGALSTDHFDYTVIGAYFVVEDFRHSGIGKRLFQQICDNRKVVFHASSHLLENIDRFALKPCDIPSIKHITIRNPSGFPDLMDAVSCANFQILAGDDITEDTIKSVNSYSKEMSLVNLLPMKETECTVAVAVAEGSCVGYAVSREVTGGAISRILIGPLHADNEHVTEALLKEVLKQYYNPETDYEFDPDVYAIYRRDVHFHIYETNIKMKKILEKLKGETGELLINRLYYKTTSNCTIPRLNFEKVFCIGDLHTSVV